MKRGTRDIYIVQLCQLVDIRELLFVLLFVINRSFILFIVQLFVLFSFPLIPCLFIVQKRKSNSDPELVQVFQSR